MPIGLQRVVRVTGGLCAQVPAETIANRTDFCAKTDRPEAAGSLGELEKCFSSLACFSPRTHLALDLYTAGPLSLDGPPGTVPSIPGLPPLTDVAPARWACRVRRCAFSNMVGTRRIRPLARFCFDAWKMLMYIRLQFDLGKEETVEQTVRNEALLAAYRRKLVEADRQLEALVRQQRIDTAKKQKEGHQDRQVEETERGAGKDGLASRHAALSRLLDETENVVARAHHHERILSELMDRVEKLELEKAVLQDHLLQAQIACWQQEQSVQGRGNVRLANKNRPPSPSSDHQALISLPTRTHSRPPPPPQTGTCPQSQKLGGRKLRRTLAVHSGNTRSPRTHMSIRWALKGTRRSEPPLRRLHRRHKAWPNRRRALLRPAGQTNSAGRGLRWHCC